MMVTADQQLLQEKYGGVMTPAYAADRERLASGEPLAYVIGWQPFLGLNVRLDSRPLIPRTETEWWTKELLGELGAEKWQAGNRSADRVRFAGKPIRFLDLCAGSGAIGCAALKFLPNAEVYFAELHPAHAGTIAETIARNGLDASRARIMTGDVFNPLPDIRFDVIASNPPYIPRTRRLPESVALHEPALALFAGTDGLDVVRRIARELQARLAPDGIAWVECDSGHASSARALFAKEGFAATIRTDQYGRPRVVVVSLP